MSDNAELQLLQRLLDAQERARERDKDPVHWAFRRIVLNVPGVELEYTVLPYEQEARVRLIVRGTAGRYFPEPHPGHFDVSMHWHPAKPDLWYDLFVSRSTMFDWDDELLVRMLVNEVRRALQEVLPDKEHELRVLTGDELWAKIKAERDGA